MNKGKPLDSLDVPGKSQNGATNCGLATLLVLPANPKREGAIFTNDSANVIYLHKAQQAAVNTGIRLNAAGGAYEITEWNLYKGPISAIAMGANSVLCWVEDS